VIRKAHGFALIDMIFVTGVIGLLMSIAMPRLILAKQSAGAASAIGTMRTIGSSQLSYALTCASGFYAPSLTTLGRPPAGSTEPFITPGLGSADTVVKSAYTIQMTASPFPGAPPSCNGVGAGNTGQAFVAGADPTEVTNMRFFAINANNVIYEHNASLYAIMPETGAPAVGQILR
jgi:type II secretory pathway pseudopilin PulG